MRSGLSRPGESARRAGCRRRPSRPRAISGSRTRGRRPRAFSRHPFEIGEVGESPAEPAHFKHEKESTSYPSNVSTECPVTLLGDMGVRRTLRGPPGAPRQGRSRRPSRARGRTSPARRASRWAGFARCSVRCSAGSRGCRASCGRRASSRACARCGVGQYFDREVLELRPAP